MSPRSVTPMPRALAAAWGSVPRLLLIAAVAMAAGSAHAQGRAIGLQELIERARQGSPLLAASRAEQMAARAGIITAGAYPNPEIELSPGRSSPRDGLSPSGSASQLTITQPLENPWMREARLRVANSRVDVAGAQAQALQGGLEAAIKRGYFDVLRLKEEVQAFSEDLSLTDQIRDRIRVRVRSGEAPRFDLVRADSEVEIARKNLDSARLRMRQAMAELRRQVGPRLEPDYELSVEEGVARRLNDADQQRLRARLAESNAEIRVASIELDRARNAAEFERRSVLPQWSLRLAQSTDPSLNTRTLGAVVTVPLVNRREGPIAEADALAERNRLTLEQRRAETEAAFDAAWAAYQAAASQVKALEDGIISRARAAVEIAEAAYRFGERGILEYLDAQRQFRLVRNELIQARHAAQLARVELERLAGL